jgi:hypothetical protein
MSATDRSPWRLLPDLVRTLPPQNTRLPVRSLARLGGKMGRLPNRAETRVSSAFRPSPRLHFSLDRF